MLKPYDVTVYFSHIDVLSKHKGIDDLIIATNNKEEIIKELEYLLVGANSRKYIHTYKVSGVSPYSILKLFGLDDVNTFFEKNKDQLIEKEFIYNGNPYYCDEKGNLVVSWKGEQNNYVRVGCDYYKKVVEKTPNKQTEINLKKWQIATIRSDYSKSKEFIKLIAKCDSFTNIPENNPSKYEQIMHSEKNGIKSKLYNRYYPVSYIPKKGSFENINLLLHHIFDYKNNAGTSLYEFILDYLKLVYEQPTKKLPVLCLVSRENTTGKTTFLNLLRAIFLENMRILDSDRISSQFNGSWAGKLIVAIDESLIAMDKDTVKNRIKMIATNQTIPLEEKGLESREIPNFSKLIMCSNDETNFMRIDKEENRYCIIKVPPIPMTQRDPELLEKMIKEIPALLDFLQKRELHYPQKSRLHFDEDLYSTPALDKVKERTENQLIKNIRDVIKDQFIQQGKEHIKLSLKVLTELVADQYKFADKIKIMEFLHDQDYKVKNPTNFEYFRSSSTEPIRETSRCYEFYYKDFLNEEELSQFFTGL
jgi:hypothetical protein